MANLEESQDLKETGLDDTYCPLGTPGRIKMSDQALNSVLILLKTVAPRTVFSPCAQVARL